MELIECQICLESFHSNNIDKVSCGSNVDHMICFDCEKNWRSKMLQQDGIRIMNCPTCRQPEQYRTTASLQRELRTTANQALISSQELNVRLIQRFPGPQRSRCASGRDCQSTSSSGRTMTRLKCIHCNIVFCCRSCTECVVCRPLLPSYSPSLLERLRLVLF